MISVHGPLRPGEFAHILLVLHLTKYDINEATEDVKSLIRLARRTDTNTLNYRAQEFVSGLAHLGGRFQYEVQGRLARTKDMLREACKVIRTKNKTTVVEFMRENFIACPNSILPELLEASGEKDIPVGLDAARWTDLSLPIDEVFLGAFSETELTWSWIGSDNRPS
jgi:hypothetical protein